MAKCMKCGGMKKYAAGGTTKKMKPGGMPDKIMGPPKKPFAAGIPYYIGAGQTGPESMKKGGAKKAKMAKGGSTFGMLSVKAGIDKNPNPTAADRIAGAKMKKAKFGASVKVQRSPKAGKVTAVGRGYAAVGKREPARIIKKIIGKKK